MKQIQTSFIIVLIIIMTTFGSRAQEVLWEKSFGGKQSEYLLDLVPTADYGFLLAGSSLSDKSGNKDNKGNGDLDYWLWKMNEKGDIDWQKQFGGSGTDMLQTAFGTLDGGFILGGTSSSNKSGDKLTDGLGSDDYWIIKLDAKGNEQWQKTMGGESQELLQTIIQTKDGGYLIGGSSSSSANKSTNLNKDQYLKTADNYGNLDYWILKLDSSGKLEWQKSFGGEYADILKSVVQTLDGGYILGGTSNSPISGNKNSDSFGMSDYWLIKIDKSGTEEWQSNYGGSKDDHLSQMIATTDNHLILAGYSYSSSDGNKNKGNREGSDIWLVKIDLNSSVLWQETYNIGKQDFLASIIENKDKTILLGCHAKSEITMRQKQDKEGVNDFMIIKLKENGEEIWRKSVGGFGEDILRKAVETRDGGYVLAGTSSSKVSGGRNSSIGMNDFWVVKLKDKDKLPRIKNIIEAIPNPANDYTNIIIGYDFEEGTASLYDLAGRQISSFPIYNRTVPIELTGLPEGIYVVNIKTNMGNDSVKVIKNGTIK